MPKSITEPVRLTTNENKLLWVVRFSWPLLGGIWGALLGSVGMFQLPRNADSFGTLLAQGFFVFAGCVGFAGGCACGMCVGGLTEKMLQRLGVRAAAAVCVATIVNAVVLWQLAGFIQARYPGFRFPTEKTYVGPPTGKRSR
jgi:hypothetical protein